MFTTTGRRLIVPLDHGQLWVHVEGDVAVLRLEPAPGAPPGDETEADAPRLRVPARALVAALRVSWADAHDLRCFEPWRDLTAEHRWRGYEPYEDRYDGPGHWFDDLGDGDPGGYRDPTVVPFPRRPPPPPGPARSGQPWEPAEEAELRDLWLAASPEADRDEVLRQVADALERGVGGISARLAVVGCDRARPGRRRGEPEDDPEDDRDDDRDDDPGETAAEALVDLDQLRRAAAAPSGCDGTRPR